MCKRSDVQMYIRPVVQAGLGGAGRSAQGGQSPQMRLRSGEKLKQADSENEYTDYYCP